MEMVLKIVVPGLLVWALYWLAAKFEKPAGIDGNGWRFLKPHLVLHFGLAISSLLWGFMWILLLRAEFSELKSDDQALPFIGLFFLFGFVFIYILTTGYLRKISWRDGEVRESFLGRHKHYEFSSIESLDYIEWKDTWRFTFVDGRKFEVSNGMHGLAELADHLDTVVP
ncbi:MAG: hypothetical protein ACK57E_03675 [Erythrobacteraceae bacterium]|jgi:hypothetical protein